MRGEQFRRRILQPHVYVPAWATRDDGDDYNDDDDDN